MESRPFARGAQPPTREPVGDRARRVGRGMGGRTGGSVPGRPLHTDHPLRAPAGLYGARFAVSACSSGSWDLGGWVYRTLVLPTQYTHPAIPVPGTAR